MAKKKAAKKAPKKAAKKSAGKKLPKPGDPNAEPPVFDLGKGESLPSEPA